MKEYNSVLKVNERWSLNCRNLGVSTFVTKLYRIFSFKRPRRLFQTWHGGPGVCLNQQFTWIRPFLRKDYYLFFLAAGYFALKS